uniref:Na:solute symporter n=1 Tax=Piromyces sp. TaxID=45796 RepID=A0A2S1TZE5_PIRSP|nr:Na:solute symporter [Piromyces sp.]
MVSAWHVIGMLVTILAIAFVGYFSGKKVKNAKDFATGGGQASTFIVTGIILGTLISGQATIGTTQLSFANGICSMWFVIGCCLGCVILAIPYAVPLRRSKCTTLMEIISKEFGRKAEYLCSVLCSIGIFISVIAQVISANALLTTIFPINNVVSSTIAIVLMAVYVIFGGVWGAGYGGIAKLSFIYVSCIIGGIIVWSKSDGYGNLIPKIIDNMSGTPLGAVDQMYNHDDASYHYKNVVARGAFKDIGNGLSVALGVICTQTYAQGVFSSKSNRIGISGPLLSAILMPPVSVLCMIIGFYMRANFITSEEASAITKMGVEVPQNMEVIERSSQAFPMFAYHKMPDFIGGIALGTLLVTVVGGGAGLSLGVSTIIYRDILSKIFKIHNPKKSLIMIRTIILIILITAAVIADLMPGTLINDYGFLSMGLRGTTVLLPLTASLFFKNKINSNFCSASIILGPLSVLISKFAFKVSFDPLFVGLGVCLILFIIGYIVGPEKSKEKSSSNEISDIHADQKLDEKGNAHQIEEDYTSEVDITSQNTNRNNFNTNVEIDIH